ncbi:putative ribonuclease H-like domain-containing protein [Tanacetum coccineum]
MNKLVKGNLVIGLPSKLFENDQTCVACQKRKQHRASCKSKTENSISLPLHLLHMDLFGPTFVKSLMKKMYCLVVTDDYSRFTWVFFLATKDETSGILKSFITGIENLVDHKVKVIRCDNRTEFKNKEMNQFCEMKGILRQYSIARTPQQNGVAKRRNRTLIKATRTMLANSKLPTTFWVEAVNNACYVQNRVLVVKPYNKTPYELFHGRTPTLSFMRPFGCPVTILNTIDHLGKFDGKADEGFFVGYSLNSKAFRVFNSRTRIVEENLHIRFSKSTPNVVGSGPDWIFNIDALTRTMNYEPIVAGTRSNGFAGTKASNNAGQARKETEPIKDYILLPLWTADPSFSQDPKNQEKEDNVNNTNNVNTVSSTVNAASTNEVNADGGKTSIKLPFDLDTPALEDYSIFDFSRDNEDDGVVADMNNLDTTIQASPTPTIRIHKYHPLDQVIGDLQSATQTRRMSKNLEEHGFALMVSFRIKRMKGTVIRNKAIVAQIEEEVYVCQPPGFEDPDFPDRVYKKLCNDHLRRIDARKFHDEFYWENLYSFIGNYIIRAEEGLEHIYKFISQDKYVGEILKKFRSMIGSLKYLTSSRPDIMFAVYACARYQVNLMVSYLYVTKRIFRYFKGQLKLGLWYAKDSPFDLVAYTDSDYAKASLDRKSTTGANEVVYKELGDSLVRDASTASSLEVEHDSGGGPSDEDRLKLDELMELCTFLQTRVLDLEKTNTTQHIKIDSLKRRVKKLKKKRSSRTHKLKRLYKVGLSARVESSGDEESLGENASKQGRINAIDADEDITLVNVQDVQDDADNDMFDVNTLTGDEVSVEQEVAAKDVNLTVDEVTLAQALVALKSVKPKVKGNVIEDPSVPVSAANVSTKVSAASASTKVSAATIPTPRKGIVITKLGAPTIIRSSQQPSEVIVQDKGKGKMLELEPVKKMSKKDQLRSDEEEAKRLQAKIKADHELAQRLQVEEQEELFVEEKAKLFQQLLEQRRKHFAAKSVEEKRNKPPTQAQQRKIMCTYLKNMEGKKLKDLKNKSFDSIQKMFDRAFKRVNTFVVFRIDLVEGSSKRAGEELEQESIKKQKVDEDKDTTELQSLMEVIPDEEEVTINVVPLAVKSPSIVDWKIHKEGRKIYYQIIRADGKSQIYMVFSHMLKSFDREDLETLYKLVKAKYGSTRPVEDLDLILWGDLKTMFEPNVEDIVWRIQTDYKVLDWKLYDLCGVHSLRMQHVHIHMLYKVNAVEGVNAASEEVSTAELVSTAYLQGLCNPNTSDNDHRLILLQEIEKIDKFASMDIIQKAHVKWDIEGDENSKFFHGLINQKRRNQMINGIMVEGNWITNPCLIKDAFLQFYKRKFQAIDSQVMFSNLPHSHSLNCMDRETLERHVFLLVY